MSKYVALDVGAESGRVILATLEHDRLELAEIHRFGNGPVKIGDSLHWDILHVWDEIKRGLRKVAAEHGADLHALGADTWGLDYALLDARGRLTGNPYCYRDPRTDGMLERALERMTRWQIYEASGGIQFLTINTLYQLLAQTLAGDPQLEIARTFVMIPDLLNYWLTGRAAVEFTNATTTQFYNSLRRGWAMDLLNCQGMPGDIFPEVVMPGTVLGNLLPGLVEETGLPALPVIAVATHDTASAVVAVPAESEDFAWLSSGTWSLLGGTASGALVTEQAMAYNFSSYGGGSGSCLPWKNIMGLWLVQECRRAWARGGKEYSYDDLTAMAGAAKPFLAVIDPDDPSFLAPKDMPGAVTAYCMRSGQQAPEDHGQVLRVVLESLALRYRWTVEKLGELKGQPYPALHIVGGGSRNTLLCQLTADACGIPVIAGPVEATAIGNAALQAVATGELASLSEARELVRRSYDLAVYAPARDSGWEDAYAGFLQLLGSEQTGTGSAG